MRGYALRRAGWQLPDGIFNGRRSSLREDLGGAPPVAALVGEMAAADAALRDIAARRRRMRGVCA